MRSIDGPLFTKMEEVLQQLGLPMDDPNFRDTPKRWVKYINEFCQPFNAEDILKVSFPLPGDNLSDNRPPNSIASIKPMVVQTNIPYRAICAHHLVPVLGHAHVGYIPTGGVVGLSKLSRLVQAVSHRSPSLQEAVGDEIVDLLVKHLHLKGDYTGAMCVISAEHGCMACRGISESGVSTVTAHLRGAFFHKPEARDEFYRMVAMA